AARPRTRSRAVPPAPWWSCAPRPTPTTPASRSTARVDGARRSPHPRPTVRAITVGFACNNACVFCAQGDLARAPPPAAAADRIARGLAAIEPGETVAFLGGEPTLHDALPAWIREADARGAARIVVQTNGRRLAYRAFAEALRGASPLQKLSLDVSLQGSTAA